MSSQILTRKQFEKMPQEETVNILRKFHENLFESHKELNKQKININVNILKLNQKIDNLVMRMKSWKADLRYQEIYHSNYRKAIQIAVNLL